MRNAQGIVFTWIQTYREIFKSALVYLSETIKKFSELRWSISKKLSDITLDQSFVRSFLKKSVRFGTICTI